MTETDLETRLIGYARVSTYGQTIDAQLSRAHLRRRRRSGIGRLTDPTAAAQLWLRAGSSCPETAVEPGSALVKTGHSMTSSAPARIEGGIVRPSAFAVFRLM